MRIACFVAILWSLVACSEDTATRMCLTDSERLTEMVAKNASTAHHQALLAYQTCGHACGTVGDERACQAYKDVTTHICKADGPEACKELCGDQDEKRNETACALLK